MRIIKMSITKKGVNTNTRNEKNTNNSRGNDSNRNRNVTKMETKFGFKRIRNSCKYNRSLY